MDEIQEALTVLGDPSGLDRDQFLRVTRAATSSVVTPFQIDLLFHLFDIDGNGRLELAEFFPVMQSRRYGGRLEVGTHILLYIYEFYEKFEM